MEDSTLISPAVGFGPYFLCVYSGQCLQEDSILVKATVLVLGRKWAHWVLSPALEQLDRSDRQLCQPGSRKGSPVSWNNQTIVTIYNGPYAGSILRTIRKGKVSHQAGKKAFKPQPAHRMGMPFKHKQLAAALIPITMCRVLAMCRTLDVPIVPDPVTISPD